MKQVLLITGGSRGVGAATARLAAASGFAVCINYFHDEQNAAALVDEVLAAGGLASSFRADVGREEDVTRLFAFVDTTLGPLSALVNCTLVAGGQSRLDRAESAGLSRILNTAVMGGLLCAREAVRRMSTRHGGSGGSIAYVASLPLKVGKSERFVDEAVTRNALEALTTALAREVAAEGIRVNAVRPAAPRIGVNLIGGTPNRVDRAIGSMPMETGSYAIEAAKTMLWLISDDSRRTTGALVDVVHQE